MSASNGSYKCEAPTEIILSALLFCVPNDAGIPQLIPSKGDVLLVRSLLTPMDNSETFKSIDKMQGNAAAKAQPKQRQRSQHHFSLRLK